MGKWAGTALFYVAQAEGTVLLEDPDSDEPSVLYAQLFQQLTAAVDIYPTMPLRIAEHHAEAFRSWLDRAKGPTRHERRCEEGSSLRARAEF